MVMRKGVVVCWFGVLEQRHPRHSGSGSMDPSASWINNERQLQLWLISGEERRSPRHHDPLSMHIPHKQQCLSWYSTMNALLYIYLLHHSSIQTNCSSPCDPPQHITFFSSHPKLKPTCPHFFHSSPARGLINMIAHATHHYPKPHLPYPTQSLISYFRFPHLHLHNQIPTTHARINLTIQNQPNLHIQPFFLNSFLV